MLLFIAVRWLLLFVVRVEAVVVCRCWWLFAFVCVCLLCYTLVVVWLLFGCCIISVVCWSCCMCCCGLLFVGCLLFIDLFLVARLLLCVVCWLVYCLLLLLFVFCVVCIVCGLLFVDGCGLFAGLCVYGIC